MSDLGDHGIGATIGAAVIGAIAAARELFARKRRKTDPPQLPEEATTLATRVGRLTERVIHVEQELSIMRQDIAQKLGKLEESVDELCIARAKTDELLPVIREQIRDLRDDLKRRANTNRE